MQVKGSYDLVVVGDQLAGLFLAAGAAQKGWKVLVLEGNVTPSVLHEIPSGRFLGDLIAEPLVGLDPNGKVDKFLRELGLYQEIDELFPRHELNQQLITDKFRIIFQETQEKLEKELRENSSLSSEQIVALSKLLTGTGNSKTKISELAKQYGLPVDVECIASLWPSIYGSMAPGDLTLGQYRTVLDEMKKGVRFPLGGRTALKERLLSKISIFGGTIRKMAWVEEIVFEYGRLTGVMLSTYEGFVKSPRVVGAMGANSFLQLIPQKMKPEFLEKSLENISSRYWRMNFCLVLPEEVLPEGLHTNSILMELGEDLAEERFLHLQVFGKEMFGGIPPDHKALIVRLLVPFEDKSLQRKYLVKLIQKALVKLEKLIPFLKTQPYTLTPNIHDFENDLIFEKFYNWTDLNFVPPILRVHEQTITENLENVDFLNWSRFGLDGLALCSRGIRPMLGLYGEMEAAIDLLESDFLRRRTVE